MFPYSFGALINDKLEFVEVLTMQTKWRDLSTNAKIVTVVSVSISALVVLLSVLQIFQIWDNANEVFLPLLGVVNLCQAYLQWNTSRKTAYFCIGTAVFIFICSLVVFLVQ